MFRAHVHGTATYRCDDTRGCLLYASTCFEHHVLIVRTAKLYYTPSGIITRIGGCPVHRLSEDSLRTLSTYAPDGHLQV